MRQRNLKAFTLIELLIVVLIIAILAAIAIPNFLEYQTRAKVARVKSDFRTIATALEAYCVDEGTYPNLYYYFHWEGEVGNSLLRSWYNSHCLTTPIAYLSSTPKDPFGDSRLLTNDNQVLDASLSGRCYLYRCGKAGEHPHYDLLTGEFPKYPYDIWVLISGGPDNLTEFYDADSELNIDWFPWPFTPDTQEMASRIIEKIYDPTNGTVSRGELYRVGGAVGEPQGANYKKTAHCEEWAVLIIGIAAKLVSGLEPLTF